MNDNIENIKEVYKALGELQHHVIFVGGAVVSLYADRETPDLRPTIDVDLVVEVWTRKDYGKLEEDLRKKGFKNDIESKILCRYILNNIIVDVMPVDEDILGFSNRWYLDGFRNSIEVVIEENYKIKIFTAPYFIASKLEAFKGRGNGDGRISHDFEDIVFVLNNRSTLFTEMSNTPEDLKVYLRDELGKLLANPYLEEWISGHLEYREKSRTDYIVSGMQKFLDEFSG